MPLLTIISIVVFIGAAVFSQVRNKNSSTSDSSPVALSLPKPTPSAVSKKTDPGSGKGKITINVDSNVAGVTNSGEKIIYPGAVSVGGNRYETSTSGDTVHQWYKEQLEQRSYNIRNNVLTKANDKFKGVLQGVSSSRSIKVTIDQENTSAKTIITVE